MPGAIHPFLVYNPHQTRLSITHGSKAPKLMVRESVSLMLSIEAPWADTHFCGRVKIGQKFVQSRVRVSLSPALAFLWP